MNLDQAILFGLLLALFGFLLWGRVRYDVVALSALFVAFVTGVVPQDAVFSGFGHPATLIVALVLIVSRGLSNSGAIELLARRLADGSRAVRSHIGVMASVAAALSAVMNNVAALAVLMPVDMRAAAKAKRSPAVTLMPLSFASILGGMVTLIGTPPNIVVATFRGEAIGEPFRMFDFAPVGLVVAVAGVAFVTLLGWRLIPAERRKLDTLKELEDLSGYVAEATVPEGAKIIDQRLRELHAAADENDVAIVGLIRRGKRVPGTGADEMLLKGDVIVLEGGPEAIEQFIGATGLEYGPTKEPDGVRSKSLSFAEVVVPDGAYIEGRSALDVNLQYRQGVTLLGVSRRGERFRDRVRKLKIRAGDILLLLGPENRLPDVAAWLGCLPLAERGLQVIQREKAWLAVGLFAGAIALATLGWLYLPLALIGVVLAYVAFDIVPVGQLYDSIEWPVIVLIGCLIPIGGALEASGGSDLIASLMVGGTEGLSPLVVLAMLMIVTMTLSDVLNNVATALIAAPIGVQIAEQLGVSPDPFLMGVAVASSCAFLTPIGHKNNTIILGPGGYRFGDYWRMGLPLELIVLAIALPMIVVVWPFDATLR